MRASQEGEVQTNLRSKECADCSWRLRSDNLPKGVLCGQPAAKQSRGLVWILVTCILNDAIVLNSAFDVHFGQGHLLPIGHDSRIRSKVWFSSRPVSAVLKKKLTSIGRWDWAQSR